MACRSACEALSSVASTAPAADSCMNGCTSAAALHRRTALTRMSCPESSTSGEKRKPSLETRRRSVTVTVWSPVRKETGPAVPAMGKAVHSLSLRPTERASMVDSSSSQPSAAGRYSLPMFARA